MVFIPEERKAVGWNPVGRHVGWAALGALIGSIVIGIPMMMTGALTNMVAPLVGSDSLLGGWIVHLLAGVIFGAPFALFVWTRSVGKGIGLGALWGLFIGVVFAWAAMWMIHGMPLVLDRMGMMDIGLHVLWGAILGLVYALALKNTGVTQPRAERRPGARPI